MSDMDDAYSADLPDYFQTTVTMIRRAYPNGIPDEDYASLLIVLSEGMGQRGLTRLMAALTGKHWACVYNDVLKAQSPFNTDRPLAERIEKVRRRLAAHGYDEWVAAEEV